MPFPFLPGGLLLSITVLGTAMVAFGIALKALDWSIDATRRTALAGIVRGFRNWQSDPDEPPAPTAPSSTEVEESVAALEGLAPVAPDPTHRRREG
jgi:hypothetical protein